MWITLGKSFCLLTDFKTAEKSGTFTRNYAEILYVWRMESFFYRRALIGAGRWSMMTCNKGIRGAMKASLLSTPVALSEGD